MYTGFVYIWRDSKRKKYCIGSHLGKLDDGYITSTGHMVKAYRKRPQDFRRRILHLHYGDHKSLLEKEQHYLSFIKDEELGNKYYNYKKYAIGVDSETARKIRNEFLKTERGKEWIKNNSERMKINNPKKPGSLPWNKGLKCPQISESLRKTPIIWTEERRIERSKQMSKLWEKGVYDNRPLPTIETVAKRAASRRANPIGQSDYQKQRVSETHKGKIVAKETTDKWKQWYNQQELLECDVCGYKHKNKGVMKRNHFERCKSLNNTKEETR